MDQGDAPEAAQYAIRLSLIGIDRRNAGFKGSCEGEMR
jgi:hypothetical protein